ncbi:DUF3108 domain-containing protein [Pseudoduganella umbonata]|uniref:DUF3108 domain-containing protein n=1 Tax=Pseudoduganella umbonata TaxID=864828 RepID=A0A4P8HXX9_9BURK|nr:hypothetical protein [Pseudoduganella umbonata]MBB3224639.1 hypothetical protein [Pseudoduganella umbonata]QCP13394.1 hypothetical protein FCL38_25380 [Pseudoduganella umbonata]
MPRFRSPLPALLSALLLGATALAHAAPQYVEVGTPLPRFHLLKEGSHRYLRYLRSADGNTALDIWQRDIHFDGTRMQIRQRWDAVGKTPSVKRLESTFETATFRPLTHVRITEKDGRKTVEGFAFAADRISGMAGLKDNTQKNLAVESKEPSFNFETDMELLQTLPLADGYEAQLVFYHAGGAAPARYTFRVAGSEAIGGPAGPVDCWIVTTDYNQPGSVSKFWYAKGTQLMVKQESTLPDGRTLVKTLLD